VRKEDLPDIDIVLLSHNHYDHLDLPTLRWLAGRGSPTFVVPMGVGELLRSEKMGPVHELDWGESISLPGATIHSVPALHFSARGMGDRNMTLWCGFMMESQKRHVYFAGDTAFGNHFAQIRATFGPPDIADFRARFGVPEEWTPIGAIAVGHPDLPADPVPPARASERKSLDELVHRGRW